MADAQGRSLPESFLLLALRDTWDERSERVAPGAPGAGLVGALLLELALRRRILLQRNRIQVVGDAVGDESLEPVARALQPMSDIEAKAAIVRLGEDLGDLYGPFKDRLQRQGIVTHRRRRHLGLFKRSEVRLTDPDARESLIRNSTRLLISGTPNAREVAFLGLAEASGLLTEFVPDSAIPFNARRTHGLITGRDELGYRVHDSLRQVQDVAFKTILENVRALS